MKRGEPATRYIQHHIQHVMKLTFHSELSHEPRLLLYGAYDDDSSNELPLELSNV